MSVRPPARVLPRRPISLVLGLALAIPFACRDATEPFRPIDRVPAADATQVRLTYSGADDRTPAWSPDGDSLYYTASRYDVIPVAPRILLALAADGTGSVTPVLTNVNEGIRAATWSSAPAPSADGQTLAFVHVRPLLPIGACVGQRLCPTMPSARNLAMVRLKSGAIHVRAMDATHGLEDGVSLPLVFLGHSEVEDPTSRSGILTLSEYHPFQFQFETTGRAFFRPSWNPDGTELAFSDGMAVMRWQPGAAAAVPIPGTEDGLMAAWSPDGDWIAYARYLRTGSAVFTCQYVNPNDGNIDCEEERTLHYTADPVIVLVRPDGSDERVLADGTDPAWSPDGAFVFASVGTGASAVIVRIDVADGSTNVVPNTTGGIEPAVSPDGSQLAFARSGTLPGPLNHDIWVVDLP